MTIVTTHYRPKRPRKRKAVALEVPAITPGKGRAGNDNRAEAPAVNSADPAGIIRSATIVRTRSRRASVFGDAPDMTPEEHRRRGDAADAIFREMKRKIAERP